MKQITRAQFQLIKFMYLKRERLRNEGIDPSIYFNTADFYNILQLRRPAKLFYTLCQVVDAGICGLPGDVCPFCGDTIRRFSGYCGDCLYAKTHRECVHPASDFTFVRESLLHHYPKRGTSAVFTEDFYRFILKKTFKITYNDKLVLFMLYKALCLDDPPLYFTLEDAHAIWNWPMQVARAVWYKLRSFIFYGSCGLDGDTCPPCIHCGLLNLFCVRCFYSSNHGCCTDPDSHYAQNCRHTAKFTNSLYLSILNKINRIGG